MREEKKQPNPAGKAGKPFTLAPYTFEDALKKILAAPPEPKPQKPAKKKPAPRKK